MQVMLCCWCLQVIDKKVRAGKEGEEKNGEEEEEEEEGGGALIKLLRCTVWLSLQPQG